MECFIWLEEVNVLKLMKSVPRFSLILLTGVCVLIDKCTEQPSMETWISREKCKIITYSNYGQEIICDWWLKSAMYFLKERKWTTLPLLVSNSPRKFPFVAEISLSRWKHWVGCTCLIPKSNIKDLKSFSWIIITFPYIISWLCIKGK